jgi:riboflavin synthase
MFTGLIEEIGIVQKINAIAGSGKQITIQGNIVLSDLKTDDSISVSGVCLTVTQVLNDSFRVDAVGETLEKSTLNRIIIGQRINLERAMRLSDRLGGHIVQGHVNGIGTVKEILQRGENWLLTVSVPNELEKYLISEGSIVIDGISLTITQLNDNEVGVSIIPHTFKNTIISDYKINQQVNIETDFLAKYVENFVNAFGSNKNSNITIEKLKELGY